MRGSFGRRVAVLAVLLLVCLVWGSTWLAIKINIRDQPPLGAAGARFILAAALIGATTRSRRLPPGSTPGTTWWAALSLAMIVLPYACVYVAEQYVPSGLAAVLFAVYPVFVALLAHRRIPGERLDTPLLAGMACGIAGVAALVTDLRDFHPRFLPGALLLLVSAASSALATVMLRRRVLHLNPLRVNLRPMLNGGVTLLAISMLVERHLSWRWTLPGIGALVYLAVLGSVTAFGGYVWLMRSIPVSRLSFIVYVTPLLALALGNWLENEPFTLPMAIGTGLVLLAVALAKTSREGPPETGESIGT